MPTQRESVDEEAFRNERIALQLRTSSGLPVSYLTDEMLKEKVPTLTGEGLLTHNSKLETISLTRRGKLVADSVAAYLV